MWDYGTPLYDIMDGLNRVVKAGKVRYIGLSNCYAYRLAKRPGETSARLEQDSYAKLKYDRTAEADGRVIERVGGRSMSGLWGARRFRGFYEYMRRKKHGLS